MEEYANCASIIAWIENGYMAVMGLWQGFRVKVFFTTVTVHASTVDIETWKSGILIGQLERGDLSEQDWDFFNAYTCINIT